MVVGVLNLDLIIHDSQSLKAKRGRVKKILSRIKNTFEVTVAEVGSQDKWQRAEIGVAAIGNDRAVINQRLDHVLNFVDAMGTAEVIDNTIELINI